MEERARLADLPIPTPPPMADLQVSRRFDYALRRPDFRSPLLSRTQAFGTTFSNRREHENFYKIRREVSLHQLRRDIHPQINPPQVVDTVGQKIRDLRKVHSSRTLDDVSSCGMLDFTSDLNLNFDQVQNQNSKYLHKDNDLTQELEEVKQISNELRQKFCGENQNLLRYTHDDPQQTIYFNEYYMSDIEEDCDAMDFDPMQVQHRRYSDSSQISGSHMSTIKIHRSMRMPSPILVRRGEHDSLSSLKSSEFAGSPSAKKLGFNLELSAPNVLKSPCRTVIKIAKIR